MIFINIAACCFFLSLVLDAVYSETKAVSWKNTFNLLNAAGLINPNKTSAAVSGMSFGHSQNTSLWKVNFPLHLSSKPNASLCVHPSVIYDQKNDLFFQSKSKEQLLYCSWMNCEDTYFWLVLSCHYTGWRSWDTSSCPCTTLTRLKNKMTCWNRNYWITAGKEVSLDPTPR